MEFLQPYSCSVGHGDLRKSISNACRLRSVLSLEVHAARASVHPAQPDRRSYTRDIPQPHPLSESVPHDLNSRRKTPTRPTTACTSSSQQELRKRSAMADSTVEHAQGATSARRFCSAECTRISTTTLHTAMPS